MSDYLGKENFCKSCNDVKSEDSKLVCNYEDSDFYGKNVKSVLLSPCHSKYGRVENNEQKISK